MEPIHWIFIGIAVLILFAALKQVLNPPKRIEWAEVPEGLRNEFEASVPGFEVTEVRHLAGARKYKVRGSYRDQEMMGEVEYDIAGHAVEIECEAVGVGMAKSGQECQLADLPPEVITRMDELMGEDHKDFAPSRLQEGSYLSEPAFDIRGTTTKWRWEFEFTASGQLIEMEKTVMAG